MRHALCTISYRHQLTSFRTLIELADRLDYEGIELWGAHASQLYDLDRRQAAEDLRYLRATGREISMISDYIDISPQADRAASREHCLRQIERARWFGARRIRIFAGNRASRDLTHGEREAIIEHALSLGQSCRESGIELLMETHPGTLLDHLEVTVKIMRQAASACPGVLGLNLDVLHLWETGTAPLEGWLQLETWTRSLHLKNIDHLDHVGVFAPEQVYAASGNRKGMRGLSEGAIDYRSLLAELAPLPIYGAVEWFGPDPTGRLSRDIAWLRARQHGTLAASGS
ncbi:sugar phosphate isomerase/epimerase family protein [Paenibacillus daejeonensis]|uniref:sugar phosphate isomerase/epimerase family protein n=1 Tax=Paenibacillus daejeonensis TaxID=135193 RepID=UPI00037E9FC4|nr:TIM barrel protein [Paenibacillus daejeonensis]